MPTTDAGRTRRADIVAQLASTRFAFPTPEQPALATAVNVPDRSMGIQRRDGGWMYPDIVVTEEPGHFLQMLVVVALRHELTEAEARDRWLPFTKAGALYLVVPAGQAAQANALCRRFKIPLAGLRTWRRQPAFGLEITDAYTGPDLLARVMALLPPALRPRAYRTGGARLPAAEEVPAPVQPPDSGTPKAAPAGAATHAAPHMIAPSVFPFIVAAGMLLAGFGLVFPAELLGAGIALLAMGVGGWILEDIQAFRGPADSHTQAAAVHAPAGVHLPPPSLSPLVVALGMMLSAFGLVFPAELLGAGVALTVVGTLGWIWEDIRSFMRGTGNMSERLHTQTPGSHGTLMRAGGSVWRSRWIWRAAAAVVGLTLALAALGVVEAQAFPPEARSQQGGDIRDLYFVIFAVAAVVFILVEAMILYVVMRYRQRPGDGLPPQIHGNRIAEIAWTGIPLVIVMALFALSFIVLDDVQSAPAEDEPVVVVDVVGRQWAWAFNYGLPAGAALTAALDERPDSTTLHVSDGTAFRQFMTVRLGVEHMRVGSIDGNTLTVTARGGRHGVPAPRARRAD